MNRCLPILLLAILAVGCHPKTAGRDSTVQRSEQDRVIRQVNDTLSKHGFVQMPCLDPGTVGGVVKQCFAFHGQPEDLLAPLSGDLGQSGKKIMQWRQDVGIWASRYEFGADQTYDMMLGLIAKGLDPVLSDKPKLKAYDGYAWYSLAAQ